MQADVKDSNGSSSLPMTQEEFDAAVSAMTPEQIQYLSTRLLEKEMKERKFKYGGKTWNLWDFGQDMIKNEELLKAGGGVDTLIQSQSKGDQLKLIPGEYFRQGQEKMQLRPKEEETLLDLTLMGGGTVFSTKKLFGVPYLWESEFSYGIYVDEQDAHFSLKDKLSGRDPNTLLEDDNYYSELIKHGPQMELTLLLSPLRDIPLQEARNAIRQFVKPQFDLIVKQQEDEEDKEYSRAYAMTEFSSGFQDVSWFNPEKRCIKKHTQFIVTCHPDGGVSVEAISPGKLKEQKTSSVGAFKSHPFTFALFSTFMGPKAVDKEIRNKIGRGFLFVVNGFSMRDMAFKNNLNRRVKGEPPNIVEENIELSLDIFNLERVGRRPQWQNLLTGIRQRKL
eukprot:TRINITY_DN1572_c0_g3_i1.p1 TRINITY_DN1572_c0_g3~~TRINITY_DN1572_c0_g3_i1.p1  ORF type:complete len:392 (-),score=53.18 TRINITY_DN1572_c0_g3_i1:208-1383(-)